MSNRSEPRHEEYDEETIKRMGLLGFRLKRRALLGGAAGAAGLVAAARFGTTPTLAAPRRAASGILARAIAQELPADAAPADQQIYRAPADVTNTRVIDFYESVYERGGAIADLFSDPLVRLNKNFEIVPGAATEWSSSEDALTWTFRLDPNLMWSDGNPVTAADYVATFRYAADPAHAWDFTWFFQGEIKNWTEVVDGEVPVEELGVTAPDDHTLVFETVVPVPYLPTKLLYSLPLSKAALETTGPLYNTNPETAVSAGPFILTEWARDEQIVYTKNPDYKGTLQVPINEVRVKLAAQTSYFTLYENDEIDYMVDPSPAELKIMQDDPELAKQIHPGLEDFRTFYLFFDTKTAPFDDLKVRQAFSHAIDRDAIASSILGPAGFPAYSWLAPGFPASNAEGLKDIQAFDPDLAKSLMAEAGFENGEGFPKQEMWLRNENPLNQTVANAVAAMLTEHLGIEVEVSNKDTDLFTEALNAKPTQIPFGYVSYGMDFLDPINMLSVWFDGGRHAWGNAEFDAKTKEAGSFTGSPEERIAMFQEAERILVEDVPGVFVYHKTQIQLIKPWVTGEALEPDAQGLSYLHWPAYSTTSLNPAGLYISNEAPEGRS